MICPNCHKKNIHALATKCPDCAADLVGPKMFMALEEKYIELNKAKVRLEGSLVQQKKQYEGILKRKKKRINWLWFGLIAIPLAIYLWFNNQPQQEPITSSVPIDSLNLLKDNLFDQKKEISVLNKQLKTIQGTTVKRELKYVIKEGDTLNELAKLFYNDSTAWYQIALDNKIHDIRGLPIGDTLVLKYRE